MLSDEELKQIKEELDNCKNPVFLYDNDADGLCSFLLLYKYKGEGKGYRHQKNVTDEIEAENIKRMQPDKIFILDVPANKITQDFIDLLKVPVVHIEHHIVVNKLKNIKTFNPTIKNEKDDPATSVICHNVVKDNLWLAAVGCVGDWRLGKETDEFAKQNPDLLNPEIKDPGKALFDTKLGKLAQIINFSLKGKSSDVKKNIFLLQKIKYPHDILGQNTEEGRKLYNHYLIINKEYKSLYDRAVKHAEKDKILLFVYEEGAISLSSELSNELVYRFPKKIVIVARKKKGVVDAELRVSVRSVTSEIRTKLIKALEGVDGTGGGHAMACGATIKEKDFDKFLEQFKAQLNI